MMCDRVKLANDVTYKRYVKSLQSGCEALNRRLRGLE